MRVYIALLRGINVGGNKKVSMPVLKQMFEKMGFGQVQTYINSGNAVFESDTGDTADVLAGKIEREIETEFGFHVDVILRTAEDLGRIIEANPFADAGSPEELHLHVGFMGQLPSERNLEKLKSYVNENDEYRIEGHELYVVFRAGLRDSKLGNSLNKLGVPVTLRNWNTTNKLFAMADTMRR